MFYWDSYVVIVAGDLTNKIQVNGQKWQILNTSLVLQKESLL